MNAKQAVDRDGTISIKTRHEDGKVVSLLVACKDVTERNRAESELRRTLAENARLRALKNS